MKLGFGSLCGGLLLLTLAQTAEARQQRPFPAAWLPRHGEGYYIPELWARRGLRYGTPELVGLIERAAREVADTVAGTTLFVADMSLRSGAWTQWHRSHRNGCDVDLIFYAVDDRGRLQPTPNGMFAFDEDGIAWAPGRNGERIRLHFDTERNWILVRAMILDPEAQVVKLFVADWLRARLLAYATDHDEDARLIARAAEVLMQPGDSEAHNDHMHVRIAPPPGVLSPSEFVSRPARGRKGAHNVEARAPHRAKSPKIGRRVSIKTKLSGKARPPKQLNAKVKPDAAKGGR